ncbi:MAG: diadenylate cyclase [Planctomycetes bacterium]|nr:diadenylate cyclase [Planctomycetota bacterium]
MFDRLTQLFHGGQPVAIAIELLVIFVGVLIMLRFLQGTRGAGVFKGIIVLIAVLVLGIRFAGLFSESFSRLRFLSEGLMSAIAIFMLVIFQPELRQAMVRIGQTMSPSERRRIDPVVDALEGSVEFLSRNQFGALIVIERSTSLAGLVAQGVVIDARISAELIESIFWPSSPLHDLAVIIRGERIAAASVQLPIADPIAGMKLGARHRAAMGASLESDCVVVIVSEESGHIRFSERGDLSEPVDQEDFAAGLRHRLSRGLRRPKQRSLLGRFVSKVGGIDAPIMVQPDHTIHSEVNAQATMAAAAEHEEDAHEHHDNRGHPDDHEQPENDSDGRSVRRSA